MPDFSVAIGLLRKPIEELYGSTSGLIQEKIAVLRTAAKIKALHKRLWESQRIKTIWHTDRPLSLISFFYPVSVIRQDGNHSHGSRLNSLDDLPDNHNIIFGTVGQGKSILLRYLLGREIKSGSRIPILCELRNVAGQPLEAYLSERFCLQLGVKGDQSVFEIFALNGKISFLLDGFDEIDPSNVQKLMQEIEDLAYKFPACRIALTSRPDSDCRHLTSFYANKICPLVSDDLMPFYKKITRDDEFSNRLVAAVKTSPLKIRELVNTPLLATLLAISYRAAHKIPLDFAEFYDELFQILLVRHDGAKQGWRRSRKTKLNDREIQQIFEAFCFATRKRQTLSVDREMAFQIAMESISECQSQVDPQHFLDDIRKITCLLIEDGKKISFVHASVQEFFASRYVRTRSEAVAAKFYEQLRTGKWQIWQEELLFLQQIDAHRARKYFVIPDIEETLEDLMQSRDRFDKECLARYLNNLAVAKSIVKRDGKDVAQYVLKRIRTVHTQHYAILDSRAFSILFAQKLDGENVWHAGFASEPECNVRTYLQIAADKGGETYSRLEEAIGSAVNRLVEDKGVLSRNVTHAETASSFIDIC